MLLILLEVPLKANFRLALEEIKFLQKQRGRKSGIPAIPSSLQIGAGGGLGEKADGDGEKEELVLQDTFAQETAVMEEDTVRTAGKGDWICGLSQTVILLRSNGRSQVYRREGTKEAGRSQAWFTQDYLPWLPLASLVKVGRCCQSQFTGDHASVHCCQMEETFLSLSLSILSSICYPVEEGTRNYLLSSGRRLSINRSGWIVSTLQIRQISSDSSSISANPCSSCCRLSEDSQMLKAVFGMDCTWGENGCYKFIAVA